MKILYHHRTQAEDGQAVHIRAMQQAFRDVHQDKELLAEAGGSPAAGRASSC